MENSEKLAFWGIALKPGETADLDLEDGETLHVSMASYGAELADKHGRSVVTATIGNSEDEGEPEKKYALCALTAGKTETSCMDVSFIGEESVTFEVSGKNIIHLVGNFSFENDLESDSEDEDDGSNLIGVYDDDNDMSDEEDEEDMPRLIMDKDPPLITELPEEEDQAAKDKKALIVKKKTGSSGKVANGKNAPPSSKKEAKAGPVKASKEVTEKDKKKVKVDEPLIDDEAEEEEEDESEDESEEEDEVRRVTSGKHDKEAISEEDDDESEMEEDEEDEESDSEDESGSENEDEKTKRLDRELSKVTKKTKGGKPGVVFKEVPPQSEPSDEKATPKSGKSKRHRKRSVSIETPDGVTPPQNKKTKISERPGTPAPSKGGSKGKAGGSATQSKAGGKGTKHSAPGSSSGKKPASVPNGVPSSPTSTPSPKDNPSAPGAGTSGRKRRRKSRKSRGSS